MYLIYMIYKSGKVTVHIFIMNIICLGSQAVKYFNGLLKKKHTQSLCSKPEMTGNLLNLMVNKILNNLIKIFKN